MKVTIIIALTLLISPFCAGFSCPDTLISDAQTFGCTRITGRLFDSSVLHLASDQQAITVTFDIKVTDICSNTFPIHLATLTTGAPGSEIRLMDFAWDGSAVSLQSSTTTTTGTFLTSPVSTLADTWLSLAISLNISSGICGGATLTPSGIAADFSTYLYNGIALDSNVKLSMCSDLGGAAPFACEVTNLKVIYTLYTSRSPLVLGQSPVVIGVYKFHEATGFITKNEVNSSQFGYFGGSTDSFQDTTNSPQWIPPGTGYGVQFTARNQYVTLSTLNFGLVNNRPASLSLGVYFWIKVDQFPASSATNDPIFRIISSDAATTRLAFYVKSDGKVMTAMGSALSTSIINLAVSTWTQVSVRFSLLDTADLPGYRMVNFYNQIAITSNYVNTTLRTTDFLSSDAFRIGEFIGQISDFRIFSPASMAVNIPTCSATCYLDVGNTNPPTCIKPECGAGEYVSPSYCVTCPSTCATCTDTGLCQTCPPGNILSAGTCTACTPGTYAASPTASTCTNCPNGCKTCTSATQCQSCEAGFFALSPTVCIACPDGKYALTDTSPTCTGNCPDNCKLCPDSLTCQTCMSGYEMQGGVCVKISGSEQNVGLPTDEQSVVTEITKSNRTPWVLISLLILLILVIIALIAYYVKRRWFKNRSFTKFIKEAFSNWSKRVFRGRRAHSKVAQSPDSQEMSPDSMRLSSHKSKSETEGAA